VAVWRVGFYPTNQQLKSFPKALIGWKKALPSKKPLCFWTCKQAIIQPVYMIKTKVTFLEGRLLSSQS